MGRSGGWRFVFVSVALLSPVTSPSVAPRRRSRWWFSSTGTELSRRWLSSNRKLTLIGTSVIFGSNTFGVLQARIAIVKNPAFFWDKVKIGKIMRSCIILHNMIVEDERDGYTQFNLSEFQQAEDNGSSHVDLNYSTDIPSNIANMMDFRIRIRDRQMHEQLKADLVEHLWSKFGRDEDNN
uniref:ENTH domain-containing protein n=1 Tax=Brassica oleracea var. oleracea TaxID=109376 RepID=A0A0D3B398_BRAOL